MNRNMQKALRAFFDPSNKTYQDIADSVGVSRQTIHNYLNDDDFRSELNKLNSKHTSSASALLTRSHQRAIKKLEEMIEDDEAGHTNQRLSAVAVLDFILKFEDQRAITERLDALEKIASER